MFLSKYTIQLNYIMFIYTYIWLYIYLQEFFSVSSWQNITKYTYLVNSFDKCVMSV